MKTFNSYHRPRKFEVNDVEMCYIHSKLQQPTFLFFMHSYHAFVQGLVLGVHFDLLTLPRARHTLHTGFNLTRRGQGHTIISSMQDFYHMQYCLQLPPFLFPFSFCRVFFPNIDNISQVSLSLRSSKHRARQRTTAIQPYICRHFCSIGQQQQHKNRIKQPIPSS